MHVLIKGGYFSGRQPSRLIRAAILDLCGDLKNEAVALVDVFAPPDFILNSPIGCADGEVSYQKRPRGDCEQLHGSFDSKDESADGILVVFRFLQVPDAHSFAKIVLKSWTF